MVLNRRPLSSTDKKSVEQLPLKGEGGFAGQKRNGLLLLRRLLIRGWNETHMMAVFVIL